MVGWGGLITGAKSLGILFFKSGSPDAMVIRPMDHHLRVLKQILIGTTATNAWGQAGLIFIIIMKRFREYKIWGVMII